jgi:assimilatory nitrate reductase catalytic subunit
MGFSLPERDRVRRFWGAPNLVAGEGSKAVALFDRIDRGEIRALWVMGTNPAVSFPDADRARASLRKLDLLVVSENVAANDTVGAGAHVLLPAAAWGEKDGTVTNSERRISRQRPFLPLPGEARPDWWALAGVARRLGHGGAFAWDSPAAIFREHAALSGFENGGSRDFDIGALADLGDEAYETMEPVLWPRPKGRAPKARFFAEGGFYTPDRRARLVAVEPPRLAASLAPDAAFRLNTGRVRDHWHTMTRTGLSPRLSAHTTAPFVAVNPGDADRLGLEDGGMARVTSASGEALLEVRVTEAQAPGHLFAPIHWSDATASHGRVGALVHAVVDPFSGQPEAKATPAGIAPVRMRRRGFAIAAGDLPPPARTIGNAPLWWARCALQDATGALLATDAPFEALADFAASLFPGAEVAEYADEAAGAYRCAATRDGRLVGCLFVDSAEARPAWDAAKAFFAGEGSGDDARRAVLSGRAPDGAGEAGPVICACFGVGLPAIVGTIRAERAHSPEAIGALLRAGTNCGSCVPELRRIVARELAGTEA